MKEKQARRQEYIKIQILFSNPTRNDITSQMNEAERRERYINILFCSLLKSDIQGWTCNPIRNFVCYKHKAELAAATSENPCFTSSISARTHQQQTRRGWKGEEYDRRAELVSVLACIFTSKRSKSFSQHFLCSPTRPDGSGTAQRCEEHFCTHNN